MLSLPKHLSQILNTAAKRAMPELPDMMVVVEPEKNKDWEYKSASAMKIYNTYKKAGSFGFPTCQDLANAIVQNISQVENNAIEKVTLAQAGGGDPTKSGFFLNIHLKKNFIENSIRNIYLADKVRLAGTDQSHEESKEESKDAAKKQRVLVDFSSPNIAKNMHVGHLRSTIQGDSICRIFEFLGYEVLRVNHVGDWGTQFGMLIAELDERFPNFLQEQPQISDLQTFYQNAKKRFDQEELFKATAYANVVKLQSGDEHCLKAWQKLCELSRIEFQKIYDRLDVKLEEVGESFYNPMLAPLVAELLERKIAVESDGAICVFVPKQKVPLMIRKSDGGFNYDTTDMAAIRYRAQHLKCDRIVYVTDIGQEFHFKQIFAGGLLCEFYNPKVTKVDHMPFGMILQETIEEGKDGEEAKKKIEKIKTREGKSVKLVELLDEARDRSIKMFKDRLESDQADTKVQVDVAKIDETAEKLGISAIKYYDLKQNRIQNYVFSFDKMLDPKGNTGVYLLYMYVRILSIMAKSKSGQDAAALSSLKEKSAFEITNPSEKELALAILRLPEQLELAVNELQLNRLCDLLYEISVKIAEFYQQSKVIDSEQEESRILLLEATRKVMEVCFDLLGMKTIEKL